MTFLSMVDSQANKFRQFSSEERKLLLQSVFFLPLIHFGLILAGYSRFYRGIEYLIPLKPIKGNSSEHIILEHAYRISHIVMIASRKGIFKASCLRRAMLVWGFLRREGVATEICFGVRVADHKLEAHAWVEYNGKVLNDLPNIHEFYQVLRNEFPQTKSGL